MAKSKTLTLSEVDSIERWDAFVEQSAEGTIFSTSQYLNASGLNYKNYFVKSGGQEVVAGLSLILSKDGSKCLLDDLVIYNGLLFSKPQANMNQPKIISNQFDIATWVAEELAKIYPNSEISLSPAFKDIRPFLWFNYHEPSTKKYTVDVRYTSYLQLQDASLLKQDTEISIFQELGYSRRQEIKYSARDGLVAEVSEDWGTLIELYQLTMAKYDTLVPEEKKKSLLKIMETLYQDGKGYLYLIKKSDGTAISAAYFCIDNKRAYYLWGANHPLEKTSSSGTRVLWDAFRHLGDLGVREVDMEGVNSPDRGWFKLTFGGDLRPYYELSLGLTNV